MSIDQKIEALTPAERKIFNAIMTSFPATAKESAYDHAINGGVKFQNIPR